MVQQTTAGETSRPTVSATGNRPWLAGIGAGIVGGIGMGLVLQFLGAMPLIGSLYGQPTLLAGWIAHLFHSVLFGLVFVAAVTRTDLRAFVGSLPGAIGIGTAYGALLGVTTGPFVLPLWANAVAGAGLPVPSFGLESFGAHLLFGLLLGVVYAVASRTIGPASTEAAPAEGNAPSE